MAKKDTVSADTSPRPDPGQFTAFLWLARLFGDVIFVTINLLQAFAHIFSIWSYPTAAAVAASKQSVAIAAVIASATFAVMLASAIAAYMRDRLARAGIVAVVLAALWVPGPVFLLFAGRWPLDR